MAKFPFTPAQGDESARWLTERLTTFGEDVLSVVPSGFQAYARVFHPASRATQTADGGASSTAAPLHWSEVAALTGRTAHRAMQWSSVKGANPTLHDYAKLRTGDVVIEGPERTLPLEIARALWPILEQHTSTRSRCLFAIWEGFGCLPRAVLAAPAFEISVRKFHLFTGPLEAVEQSFCTNDPSEVRAMSVMVVVDSDELTAEGIERTLENPPLSDSLALYQSANLWWPEGCAWCVATKIDFNTTYVSEMQRLVDTLLACKALEVYQVEPTDGVAYDGDTLDPPPNDPYGGSFRLE